VRKWKKYLYTALAAVLIPASAWAVPIVDDNPEVGKKLSLPVYCWSDWTQPTKGIVVAVHGLTFYAYAYNEFARYMASHGYRFYAADMRGFGRWKVESSKFNGDSQIHFSQTKEDYLRILDFLRRANPDTPIYCMGESLGANIAFWAASNHSDLVDGVIVSSPCYKRWIHPRLRWIEDFCTCIWDPTKQMNLEPYINPYLSDDRALTIECLKDQLICRKMSPVDLIKTSITNKDTLRSVESISPDMPVLIIAGERDAVFKTSSIPELVKRLGSRHTSLNILEGKGHLLLEHQSVNPKITNIVDDWLSDKHGDREEIGQVPGI
jgi:alpha-beta hydrolase superfamily lysophospholipase